MNVSFKKPLISGNCQPGTILRSFLPGRSVGSLETAAKGLEAASIIRTPDGRQYYDPSVFAGAVQMSTLEFIKAAKEKQVDFEEVDLLEGTDFEALEKTKEMADNTGADQLAFLLRSDLGDVASSSFNPDKTVATVLFDPARMLHGNFSYELIGAHELAHLIASRMGYDYTSVALVPGADNIARAIKSVSVHPVVYNLLGNKYGYSDIQDHCFTRLLDLKESEFPSGRTFSQFVALLNQNPQANVGTFFSNVIPSTIYYGELLSWLPEQYHPRLNNVIGKEMLGQIEAIRNILVPLVRIHKQADFLSTVMSVEGFLDVNWILANVLGVAKLFV